MLRSVRGRAVQGATLRWWSLRRRGFEPHRTQFLILSGDLPCKQIFLIFFGKIKMQRIGLTGTIGSGKSTVAKILKEV